jgi:hypothetical protein
MTYAECPERRLHLVWNAERPSVVPRQESDAANLGTFDGRSLSRDRLLVDFDQLRRGLYISGKPRTGKSTAILNLVLHDFARGRGACVIDPHGELIDRIIERLPLQNQADLDRVIVFDPANLEWPIGIDLLDAKDSFEEDHAIQFMIEVIERITPPFARGPVLFQSVRNAMRLLFETGGRLTDISQILTSPAAVKQRLGAVTDPLLRRYWEHVWPMLIKGGDGPSTVAYVTSKFSQFVEDRCLRNIFGQRGGLDFRRVIDEGQLLLVDLARGTLGSQRSQFLGLIVLHCLERAVMRAPASNSGGFSVYLDEVHEFDVENLRRMITAFPKQHAALVMANQSANDLGVRLRETILGSVATFLILRQGLDAASRLEALTQPRFDDRDLMSLKDHHAVYRGDTTGSRRAGRVALSPPPRVLHDPRAVAQIRQAAATKIGEERWIVEASIIASLASEVR